MQLSVTFLPLISIGLGLIAIVIDKSAFPYYESYKNEIKLLFADIESTGTYIPGNYDKTKKYIFVSSHDLQFINQL